MWVERSGRQMGLAGRNFRTRRDELCHLLLRLKIENSSGSAVEDHCPTGRVGIPRHTTNATEHAAQERCREVWGK